MNVVSDCIVVHEREWRESQRSKLAVRLDFPDDPFPDLEGNSHEPAPDHVSIHLLDDQLRLFRGEFSHKVFRNPFSGPAMGLPSTAEKLQEEFIQAILGKSVDLKAYFRLGEEQAEIRALWKGSIWLPVPDHGATGGATRTSEGVGAVGSSAFTSVALKRVVEGRGSQTGATAEGATGASVSPLYQFLRDVEGKIAAREKRCEDLEQLGEENEEAAEKVRKRRAELEGAMRQERELMIRKAINLVNAEKGRGAEPHGITGEEKGLKRRKVEDVGVEERGLEDVGVLGKMDMEEEEEEEEHGSPLFHSPPSPPGG